LVIAGEPWSNHGGRGGVFLFGNGEQNWEHAGPWLAEKQKQLAAIRTTTAAVK
jgi:hypothetical protein